MDMPKEIQEQIIIPDDHTQRPRLKPQKCPDCDRVVDNRTVEIRQTAAAKQTVKHIKQKCTACKLVRDPVTGEFCWNFSEDRVAATKRFYTIYHK